MLALDLLKLPAGQTKTLYDDCKDSPETKDYIDKCLVRYFLGDYGEIDELSIALNKEDLEANNGHTIGRYRASGNLAEDILVYTRFSKTDSSREENSTTIMYYSEKINGSA